MNDCGGFVIKILSIILGITVFIEFIMVLMGLIREYIIDKEDKSESEI